MAPEMTIGAPPGGSLARMSSTGATACRFAWSSSESE
jgi:hypothetical protein